MTSRLQNTDVQKAEELDSMKESISDIINQLQDIDPARLSFSPFLDLDTQICMAPVSDSPESSVEELHSSPHSVTGSQRSLGPPPASGQRKGSTSCHVEPHDDLPQETPTDAREDPDQTLSSPVITADKLESASENCISPPAPASQGDIPNGTDALRWSPETTRPDSGAGEHRPLIGRPPESVELSVWSPEAGGEPLTEEVAGDGRCCCCCRCKCCQSGRVPAFLSVLASLLCAAGILYGLYFHVPLQPPDFPDLSGRMTFTLCCCLVASLPVLLAMIVGQVCQFCSGSLSLQAPQSGRQKIQQMFVKSSLELLFLYVLNLVLMTFLLPREEMKLVPILAIMFVIGRIIYLLSLYDCGSWRGFGSGLTVFPLLAMVALNVYLMYTLLPRDPWLGSRDVHYNQVTPSSWPPGNASQSPSSQPDTRATDTQ